MKATGATTVLQVGDIATALAFYCGVLGFTEDFRYASYAGVVAGQCSLHLCAHNIWKRPVGGGAVSIYLDEVDDYCKSIEARSAAIASYPADQYYGLRDFVVSDPDGNVLTFACPLPETAK